MRLCEGKFQAHQKLREQEKRAKKQGSQKKKTNRRAPLRLPEPAPDESVSEILDELGKDKTDRPYRCVTLCGDFSCAVLTPAFVSDLFRTIHI